MAKNEISPYENRDKVMASGGFKPELKSGYGSDVLQILFSLFLIIGGLSGRMVLRFTDSSPALVVAGCLFLVWDIVSIFRKKAALEKDGEERYARSKRMYDQENAVKADGSALEASIPVRIAMEKGIAALDFSARLNGSTMTRDIPAKAYTGNTSRIRNIVNFNNLDLTVVFEVDPYATEVVLDLFRDKTGIGIALPDNVRRVEDV